MIGCEGRSPGEHGRSVRERLVRAGGMRRLGSRARALALALGVGIAALSTAACGPDFAPYQRLESLRVLGVQAEPASPATGETTTLTPFIYTPDPATPTTATWSWCPAPGKAGDGYPCLVDEPTLAALVTSVGGDPATIPPFELGTSPTAMFANTLDPALLAGLCQGQLGAVPIDCTGGFPVQIRVKVATADDEIDVVRTLRLRFDPNTPPNANPSLESLSLVTMADGMETLTPVTADPTQAEAVRNQDNVLRLTLPPDQAELYDGLDADGNPATLTERLFVTWYFESGDSVNERTDLRDDGTFQNTWTPGKVKDYPADTSRIITVIHDNRGGLNWLQGAVTLVGKAATP